jgi:hypothetical protein
LFQFEKYSYLKKNQFLKISNFKNKNKIGTIEKKIQKTNSRKRTKRRKPISEPAQHHRMGVRRPIGGDQVVGENLPLKVALDKYEWVQIGP